MSELLSQSYTIVSYCFNYMSLPKHLESLVFSNCHKCFALLYFDPYFIPFTPLINIQSVEILPVL